MLKTNEDKKEFERRDNSGNIFVNKYKNRDNQPDFQGECMVGGQMYRIAGWQRTTRNGDDMMSLAFTTQEEYEAMKELRKQQREDAQTIAKNTTKVEGGQDDFNDDIPF